MKIRFNILHCLTWISFLKNYHGIMVLIPKSIFVSTIFFLTKFVETNIMVDIIDYDIFNLKTSSRNLSWFSHFYHMSQTWGFTSLGWRFEFFNNLQFKFLKICKIKEMIPIFLNPFKTNPFKIKEL
jgi:hypothetical protein